MSFDEDRNKKLAKEKPSSGSPKGWRNDKFSVLKREVEITQKKEELHKLREENMNKAIEEMNQESRAAKDERTNIVSADESITDVDPDEFVTRTEERESERKVAMDQAPEQEGEDVG